MHSAQNETITKIITYMIFLKDSKNINHDKKNDARHSYV